MSGSGPLYERLAPTYDRRYEEHDYRGVEETVRSLGRGRRRALEVGCGTGRWLSVLEAVGCRALGLDPAGAMLSRARARAPGTPLVRGVAESLPLRAGSVDLILVVNAAHHFSDLARFSREAARVLGPEGSVAIIGLDPSLPLQRWFVWDYFQGTLEADRARYPSTRLVAGVLADTGFDDVRVGVAQRWTRSREARAYLARGGAEKASTSTLALLDDDAYARGLEAIDRAASEAEAGGSKLRLAGDLILHVTTGRLGVPGPGEA